MAETLPWVELGESNTLPDLESKAPLDRTFAYLWQAVIACQVFIRPFQDLLKFKWGFSPAFLWDEARDRQRLFIEALHINDCTAQDEWPEKRSLALRVVHSPGQPGLLLSLFAKVCAPTQEVARQAACAFWYELRSIFPIDYILRPAATQDEFHRLAGWDILRQVSAADGLAQICRFNSAFNSGQEMLYLSEAWETIDRSDEQIWRALAGSPEPVLLDLLLRPTVLQQYERLLLTRLSEQASRISKNNDLHFAQPFAFKTATQLDRRLAGLTRPYFVQVRLASPTFVPDFVSRAVGSALTRSARPDAMMWGYQIKRPTTRNDSRLWEPQIYWLERLPNPALAPNFERLQDMADLGEAQAVFRLPYPPEQGLPGVTFEEPETPA